MSFKSVLSDIGHVMEKVFTFGIAGATAAEPFVDIAFPGIAALFNTTVTAASSAEASALAAGAQNGTGPQKLALVVQSVETSFNAYAQKQGIAGGMTQAQIEAAVNGIVQFLNNVPSSVIPAPATPEGAK